MPTFVCEKCGCVDNSACGGTYWSRYMDKKDWPIGYNGELLCVVCAPKTYKDGSVDEKRGKWHGYFPRKTKEEWDEEKKKLA